MKLRLSAAIIMIILISIPTIQLVADTRIIVSVDGTIVPMDIHPELINGRLMAPVRAISESLSATVSWDDGLRQISVFSHDRYVRMRIGDTSMHHGRFHTDASGAFSYDTRLTYVLDAPPVEVNGNTLVPLRAFAEGLGAEVIWDPGSSVVYINTTPSPQTPQRATPTPTPVPSYNNRYFTEISANQAQQWYDVGAPYILFYYSHLSESSMAVLQWAQQAAGRQNLMVYGVNIDSTRYNNTGSSLTFIWKYLDRNSEFNKPALLFVSHTGAVMPLVRPRNLRSIEFAMTAFAFNESRAPASAFRGNDRPRPIPNRTSINISPLWREITRDEAIQKYRNDDRFIYIAYNSANSESNALIQMVWLAVEQTNTVVYATDFARLSDNMEWFGRDALNGRQLTAFPVIFFVSGRDYIPFAAVQPRNILEVMNGLYNFTHHGR